MTASNLALARFGEVTVRLAVELGRTQMPLKNVLSLAEGSVVALDRLTDELLDVTANGRVVAQGEVVAQDGRFALRIVNLADDDTGPVSTQNESANGGSQDIDPASLASAIPARAEEDEASIPAPAPDTSALPPSADASA